MAFMNCVYLYDCLSFLKQKMIYHKIHICNLYIHHELYGGVSPIYLIEKMIYYKIHICNLCGLHELCECVSLNDILKNMIYHNIHMHL